MLVPHGTIVAVLDGGKLELFRNDGRETKLELSPLPSPALEPHSKDAGKRHRASAANPDKRLLAEDSFVAATVEWLNHEAIEGKIDRLIVIAAPRALGELRRRYHKALSERIVAEIGKDLTGQPVAELEAALAHAKAS